MSKYIRLLERILLIFFAYLTVSCNQKKEYLSPQTIPVRNAVGDYHMLNISNYATDIRYIPLETDSLSLVAEIKQIIFEDERILVSDQQNNCYLFYKDGKFDRRIGELGRGPNEYIRLYQVFMQDGLIFINDLQKMLIYDPNGLLVDNINLRSPELREEYMVYNVLPLEKDIFVMDVVTYNNGYYPKAVLFGSNQSTAKPVKEYPSYIKLNKVSDGMFSLANEVAKMYRFKDEVRTYKFINYDTLFTIGQDREMKEAFIFDLGEFRPTMAYFEWRDRSVNFIRPERIFESTNHLFIEFFFGRYGPEPFQYTRYYADGEIRLSTNSNVCGVFDKSTGGLTLMLQAIKGKLGFKNDIDNGPVLWPQYISSNNELITYVSAEDFLDYYDKIENPKSQLAEIANKIKVDDNPIAIIAKLKTH